MKLKIYVIFRPALCGAFLCFLHIKSHHEKTVVANLILPLIMQTLCRVLFLLSVLSEIGKSE